MMVKKEMKMKNETPWMFFLTQSNFHFIEFSNYYKRAKTHRKHLH